MRVPNDRNSPGRSKPFMRRLDLAGSWNAGIAVLKAGVNAAQVLEYQFRVIVDRIRITRKEFEDSKDAIVRQQQRVNQDQALVDRELGIRRRLIAENQAAVADLRSQIWGIPINRRRVQSTLDVVRDTVEGRTDTLEIFTRLARLIPGLGATAFAGAYIGQIVRELVAYELALVKEKLTLELRVQLESAMRTDMIELIKSDPRFADSVVSSIARNNRAEDEQLGRTWHRDFDLEHGGSGQ